MKIGRKHFLLREVITLLVFGLPMPIFSAENTWAFAVQISAEVRSSPPQIRLSWRADPQFVTNYTVYRKLQNETDWGLGQKLSGNATHFLDTNVDLGAAYEYRIVKQAQPGYTGFGYIFAGIEAPLVETRGKLILIVANTHAGELTNELARLESDLVGDGWRVVRHDVSSAGSPEAVRNLIISDYDADPANVKAVFLFGHVPVLRSGNLNYDGHLARPMPADAFYGDVSGDWSGSPGFLPAEVQLMVGRVDMFNMTGAGAPIPWPSEVELLRNYLNKDHNWRHKMSEVPRRALMGNRRGDELGEASASSGYRNFEPLVGPGNTVEADTEDMSVVPNRWGPRLAVNNYLWAYGCGGGFPDGISHLGTNGEYNSLLSTDIVGQDAKAVFVMLFGSWFADWDQPDNFMRAFLATPTLGLACGMAGRPHWFLHHMGLGEPIGYGVRLSMNNSTLYQNQSNRFTRAVYIALMGDPTLRMDMVTPPAAFTGNALIEGVQLNWTPSSDAVLGYHLYRRSAGEAAFMRLTDSLLTETSFVDTNQMLENCTYMVRAVKLQSTPSGTYLNASQGIFVAVAVPIQVVAQLGTDGLTLTWNSQEGAVYRVLAGGSLTQDDWSDVSGDITAVATSASWTEPNPGLFPQRFYRIKTP